MTYTYYPGCNLEGACKPYDRSLRRVFQRLGQELRELDDWTCCGATLNMSVREITALSVSARNLALAARRGDSSALLTPCAACYSTLRRTQEHLRTDPDLRGQVAGAMAAAGLPAEFEVEIRHPLDVMVNDIGAENVARRVERELAGLNIAAYYGCQLLEPGAGSAGMEEMFKALGAECHHFPARDQCCGGTLIATYPEVGPGLTAEIFDSAIECGADVIATACPLCHINLEDHQRRTRADREPAANQVPVLFFTQLIGIALGEHFEDMDLHLSLAPPGKRLCELAGAL